MCLCAHAQSTYASWLEDNLESILSFHHAEILELKLRSSGLSAGGAFTKRHLTNSTV